MTPLPGNSGYRFDGKIKLDELLAIGGEVSVASLVPASWNQVAAWLQQVDGLRRAA